MAPELLTLDRLDVAALVVDDAGRCRGLTGAAARLLGIDAGAVEGREFAALLEPVDARVLQATLGDARARSARVATAAIRFPRPDATHVPLSIDVVPTPSTPGQALVRLTDLSIQREIEDERSALFHVAADPMCIASPDGFITHVNPAWTRVLGWTGADMRTRPFLDFVHPDDRADTEAEARRTFKGQVRQGFRNRYLTREGGYRRLEWSTFVGHDGRAYSSVRDVTELAERHDALTAENRQHLHALQASQRQMQAHLHNAPLAVIEFDAGFHVTRWEGQATAMFGWTADEVIGRHPDDWGFAHSDDLPAIHVQTRALAAGGVTRQTTVNRNLHKDGSVLTCQWFNSVIRDDDGGTLSILSLGQDISDRMRLQNAAQEAEAQFQATFEQAAVGIAHVGLDGSWLRTNAAFCEFLGYSADELQTLTFQDITHPQDLDADLSLVGQVLSGEINRYRLEKRYIRKDGAVAWGRLTVSLRVDASGAPLHFISIVEDIAETKQAQVELQRAYAELETRVEERTGALARLNQSLSAEVEQRREMEQLLRDNDARMRSILQHSHDAFVAINEDGRVTEWNRAAESTFGWRRSEAIGRPLAELIVPAVHRDAHRAGLERFITTGRAHVLNRRIELPAVDRSGREFPVEITISAVQLGGKRIFTAFLHDVSDRKEAEARRIESERQLKAIMESSPAMMAYLDRDERYRFVNEAFLEWYEVTREQVIGQTVRGFRGEAGYARIQPHLAEVWTGSAVTFEREFHGPGGKTRHCQVSYVPDVAESGEIAGFHAMIYDTTAQHQLTKLFEERAMRDELTGLPNRMAWKEELVRGLARAARAGTGAAVMFLDLNGFKQVNDTHGHEAGDEVLRQFAQRLRDTLRQSDFIARLAGDEFVVLLDRVTDLVGDPPTVAGKILEAMDVPMDIGGVPMHMAASIGIAVQDGPQFDAQCLMRRADEAMYAVKRDARQRYRVLDC